MMKKNFHILFVACLLFVFLTSCYIPRTGLYDNEIGTRYYIKDVYQTGWQEIDSKIYYFSKIDGYMIKASQSIGGTWYGFNSDGTLANGFLKDKDGTRYYVDGIYQTSWQDIEGHRYYFYSESGLMATGKVTIKGVEYSFSPEGRLLEDINGEQS